MDRLSWHVGNVIAEQRCEVRSAIAYSKRRTHTGVHSGNTGKLWKYTRNQNLSSPRGGCRAGILTCFHLFKPVKVDSVCVCVCVFVFAFVFVCVCVFVFVCVRVVSLVM